MQNQNAKPTANKSIIRWLYISATIVFAIVVIGGVTRLTRSGLSIVEWKPVSGVVPPIGEAQWQTEFDKYKQTPEYRLVNRGMTLSEFKNIFWWEFIHRIFARLVGVVFLFPFLWFLIRKHIRGALAVRLGIVFALGAFQGFLGWYMVKSGLVNDPHVSHLRLMSHLMTAVLIYAMMLMTAWGLKDPEPPTSARSGSRAEAPPVPREPRTSMSSGSRAEAPPVPREPRTSMSSAGWAWFNVVFAFVILASGALVAGLKAGKMYNTFPLMNGQYFPQGMWGFTPALSNLTDNPIMVQFIHRNFAYAFGIVVCIQLWRARPALTVSHPLSLLAFAYVLQFFLGVFTLLNAVPVSLGALHQANALILFTAALHLLARTRQRV
ncbi:MAG: COX15/CtaA family protein [Turneriella sp.]